MGLFSGETVITVASSVYNLAGDEKDRPIFLKNLVIRNILSGTKKSLAETMTAGYLHGPGIKFRSFFRWAVNNYDLIGMPTGSMFSGDVINTQTVANNIPHAADENIWVQEAWLDNSDFELWARQFMIKNYPAELDTAWEADFDVFTKIVKITRVGGQIHNFVAVDFVNEANYIFAYFTRSVHATSDAVVAGSLILLDPLDDFPDTSDYGLSSNVSVSRNETLNKLTTITKTYSDGRPPENSNTPSSQVVPVVRQEQVYLSYEDLGIDPDIDVRVSKKYILNLFSDYTVKSRTTTNAVTEDIGGSVTRTTTTMITEDVLEAANSYREDTQKFYETEYKPLEMFIYRIGSGNSVLDAMQNVVAEYGQFFPMIPMRLNGDFLADLPGLEDQLALAKKAFKKGTDGGKYDRVIDDLSDSDDIGDMDYIYVVYGVSLNAVDQSARRYMYDFFQRLMGDQIGGEDSATQFATDMAAYTAAYNVWLAWKNRPRTTGRDSVPINVGSAPPVPPVPTLPQNELVVSSRGQEGGTDINYDIRLRWIWIIENNGIGKGKPTAKKGDIWFEYRGETVVIKPTYTENNTDHAGAGIRTTEGVSYQTVRLWWQYEDNAYRYLDIAGLHHKNFVYGGKAVTITAKEALEDGDESGFLVPLHYATFKAMRLLDSTQMSTASVYLVINSYQKTKQKWWQTGFFKIIFVVVIAVVSVAFTGGAGLGLLGTNAFVGASLGLTGITGAIIGSIANALAAMVLTTIITKITENMGVFGAILGAVIGIVLSGAIQSFTAGNGFNFNFADLMKADNILKLTDAAGKGYAAYIQSSITGMQNELTQLQENANAELRRVREAYFNQFGYGGGQVVDPTMYVGDNSPVIAESRDTFLSRTLMTGSDVAQMSHDMLSDYVSLMTTLPDAFT